VRLLGPLAQLAEKDSEIVGRFAWQRGAAAQDFITRQRYKTTAYDSALLELYRKEEADRSGAREQWHRGLSPPARTALDNHCLTIAGVVLLPLFPAGLPASLRGPLARLALEYAAVVRRADAERKEREKCLAHRGLGVGNVVESILRGITDREEEARSRLEGRWFRELTPEQAAAFDSPGPHADRGGKTRAKQAGKPPLEESAPLQFQVYKRIQEEHRPATHYRDTVDRLKTDKQFAEQVSEAGLKLNTALVRRALAFFNTKRKRNQARNKQQTDLA
jgi:hypothetical protein